MRRRRVLALGLLGALAVLLLVAGSSCSSSNGASGLANNCTINSDCNAPLICAFSRCHEACAASRDCPNGERCLVSGTSGVCQLAQESTCAGATATCATGQVCGTDKQCRAVCMIATDCAHGDFCVPNGSNSQCFSPSNAADEPVLTAAGLLSPDGAVLADGSPAGGPDGQSSDGSTVGASDGSLDASPLDGSRGVDGGPTGNSCPSAQTQFSSTATGDTNPYFTSGVGARTAKQLLAFDSYVGPDPAGDGGGEKIGAIYAQAFDPVSGNSAGPALALQTIKNLDTVGHDAVGSMIIAAAAIAPTGQIALVYSVQFIPANGAYNEGNLYAAFLDLGGDAGAGLRVQRTALLTTAPVYDQAYAIWSTTSNAFVFSWYTADGGQYTTIQKFLANGLPAGGNSTVVPTDSPSNMVVANSSVAQGGVGESAGLFGVAYGSAVMTYTPALTVLDPSGTAVGAPFVITTAAVSGNPAWMAVGGTSQGFVYFYDSAASGGVAEVFLPSTADAGVVGAGSDASTFATFTFPGTVRATAARAIDDSAGGVGGVGLALLYANGVSFAYVQADGTHHVGPSPVLPHAMAAGDYESLTNLNGSFVVSLYSATNHLTQVAASGCTP